MPQRGFQFHEYDDEYSLPGDEVPKKKPVKYEKPDLVDPIMRQAQLSEVVNRNVQDLHTYYNKGGYQYGKRSKKRK